MTYILSLLLSRVQWPWRIVLIVVSIMGFVGFDMAYSAVIINYSIECQLMIYYLKSICQRISAKEWEIDQAIKVNRPHVI